MRAMERVRVQNSTNNAGRTKPESSKREGEWLGALAASGSSPLRFLCYSRARIHVCAYSRSETSPAASRATCRARGRASPAPCHVFKLRLEVSVCQQKRMWARLYKYV